MLANTIFAFNTSFCCSKVLFSSEIVAQFYLKSEYNAYSENSKHSLHCVMSQRVCYTLGITRKFKNWGKKFLVWIQHARMLKYNVWSSSLSFILLVSSTQLTQLLYLSIYNVMFNLSQSIQTHFLVTSFLFYLYKKLRVGLVYGSGQVFFLINTDNFLKIFFIS